MEHEKKARQLHKLGNNCSKSVYTSFGDVNVTGDGVIPAPRSDAGKCGAVIAAKKVMKELGIPADEFEKVFEERFGSILCKELMSGKRLCNDYVGMAASYIDKKLSEE